MLRAVALATLLLVMPIAIGAQEAAVLRIRIVLVDAERKPVPVSRHELLISDNPSTTSPRIVSTGRDGTVEVRLRPGNYTVESDHPVSFGGRAYQWTRTLDVAAGRDTVLELTADNAEVGGPASDTSPADGPRATPLEADPSFLLPRWQNAIVELWAPKTHASGFVIDARGLVATNQRVVGGAASIEVQLSPAVKVAAKVLAADAGHDVAVLWIDPQAVVMTTPVPLACDRPDTRPIEAGLDIFALGAPFGQPKDMSIGTVSRVDANGFVAGFVLPRDSAGGPVFRADGVPVGLTSIDTGSDESRRTDFRVIRTSVVCDVMAGAEKQMAKVSAPSGTHLPVEPTTPFPADAIKEAVSRRAGSLNPYQQSSASFDVSFITPLLTYGVQHQAEQAARRERGSGSAAQDAGGQVVRSLLEFGVWSDYVSALPPVLVVRVTPKLTENFWTTVGRAAAQTQGMALPPLKKFKPGFARMRAYCGEAEVTPIHALLIEQRLQGNDAINEGLYVYDPAAFGPQCETVKLLLYSEKEPQKAETRVIEPRILQLIANDFAPYRNPRP